MFSIFDGERSDTVSPDNTNVHVLKLYFKLLSQLQIFLVCFTEVDLIEIEHIALRIYLGCLSVNKEEIYVTVSQLITPVLTSGIFNLKSEVRKCVYILWTPIVISLLLLLLLLSLGSVYNRIAA